MLVDLRPGGAAPGVGLLEGRFSFATAVGLFQSVIGLILILTTNKLSKKYGEGGLW